MAADPFMGVMVMGKVAKGVGCSVKGCGGKAVKSVSAQRASQVLSIGTSRGRAYLCKTHYNEYKKKTRKERRIERWRYTQL